MHGESNRVQQTVKYNDQIQVLIGGILSFRIIFHRTPARMRVAVAIFGIPEDDRKHNDLISAWPERTVLTVEIKKAKTMKFKTKAKSHALFHEPQSLNRWTKSNKIIAMPLYCIHIEHSHKPCIICR